MGKRREGREAAVQFLYQFEVNRRPIDGLLIDFWKLRSGPSKAEASARTRDFTAELVNGVVAHLVEIDAVIGRLAANYDLHRIAAVDRNILRMAIYEMLHCPDVPPVVSINEAIEIAKKFGSEESSRFVNGILDRVRGELKRPSRDPVASGKKSKVSSVP
jgi:N utilization substance protein B